MRRRVLCAFPGDPLAAYLLKGEIKPRYFNPEHYFDEVHILSLSERDVQPRQVSEVAGRADLVIHPVGAPHASRLVRFQAYRQRILALVRTIQPDALRAYNPLLAGYLAVWCGQALRRPSVISLHGNYDEDIRGLFLRQGKWLRFAKYLLFRWTTEPYALRHADHVICAYQFPAAYARRYRTGPMSVIYNRVDLSRFCPPPDGHGAARPDGPLRILTVGRLVSEKNHACLIKAIRGLPVQLTVIGDGEQRDVLKRLAQGAGVAGQMTWIPSVPHAEVHRYYQEADVFALATRYGGVQIPVLEAMASGLPVVRAKSEWSNDDEVRGEFLISVDNRPEAFRAAFRRLLDEAALRSTLGLRAREAARAFDAARAEAAERQVYEAVLARDRLTSAGEALVPSSTGPHERVPHAA